MASAATLRPARAADARFCPRAVGTEDERFDGTVAMECLRCFTFFLRLKVILSVLAVLVLLTAAAGDSSFFASISSCSSLAATMRSFNVLSRPRSRSASAILPAAMSEPSFARPRAFADSRRASESAAVLRISSTPRVDDGCELLLRQEKVKEKW